MDFEANMPKFEAMGAQVVGVSADHVKTIEAFVKQNNVKHLLVSDFRRQMLPGWDAVVTDQKSPIYHYAKRAYFVLDRNGVVKFVKVMDKATDLLKADEVLAAVREAGK